MKKNYVGSMDYTSFIDHQRLFDGTVQIEERVKFYRYEPYFDYQIYIALKTLSDDDKIKVMKYITRITGKRLTFDLKTQKLPKMSKGIYKFSE